MSVQRRHPGKADEIRTIPDPRVGTGLCAGPQSPGPYRTIGAAGRHIGRPLRDYPEASAGKKRLSNVKPNSRSPRRDRPVCRSASPRSVPHHRCSGTAHRPSPTESSGGICGKKTASQCETKFPIPRRDRPMCRSAKPPARTAPSVHGIIRRCLRGNQIPQKSCRERIDTFRCEQNASMRFLRFTIDTEVSYV